MNLLPIILLRPRYQGRVVRPWGGSLHRIPDQPERVASRLIALACSLSEPSKVRECMQCSESNFQDYCAARKAPTQPELERLIDLIVREQSNVITKNKELLSEIRAQLAKFDRPQRPD
jgi:hypothetical protein